MFKMPFTTFHLIAGISVKSVFPRYFSFSTFAFSNIFIDSEVLYFLIITGVPYHRFFHTFIGASLIAIFVVILCKPICEYCLRIWNKTFKMEKFTFFKTDLKITRFAAWSGALIGAYSQLILDSIMHSDISVFFPLTEYNGLHRIISVESLHDLCFMLFFIGIVIFVLKKLTSSKR